LKNDGHLAMQFASTLLRQEMDRIPLWRGNHVPLKQLVEDFAKYLYLHRVAGPDVVVNAARDGISLTSWSTDTFAYAESWDEARGRYAGLQAARILTVTKDSQGLVVKPGVAAQQLALEGAATPTGDSGPILPDSPARDRPGPGTWQPFPTRLCIIWSVSLAPRSRSPLKSKQNRQMAFLRTLCAQSVTENCRTLKFKSQGFEKH
jgi:hypothetical protein